MSLLLGVPSPLHWKCTSALACTEPCVSISLFPESDSFLVPFCKTTFLHGGNQCVALLTISPNGFCQSVFMPAFLPKFVTRFERDSLLQPSIELSIADFNLCRTQILTKAASIAFLSPKPSNVAKQVKCPTVKEKGLFLYHSRLRQSGLNCESATKVEGEILFVRTQRLSVCFGWFTVLLKTCFVHPGSTVSLKTLIKGLRSVGSWLFSFLFPLEIYLCIQKSADRLNYYKMSQPRQLQFTTPLVFHTCWVDFGNTSSAESEIRYIYRRAFLLQKPEQNQFHVNSFLL